MSQDDFHKLANQVCEELPEGWLIEIGLEKGSGWVSLFDGGNSEVEIPGYDTESMTRQILTALRIAKGEL